GNIRQNVARPSEALARLATEQGSSLTRQEPESVETKRFSLASKRRADAAFCERGLNDQLLAIEIIQSFEVILDRFTMTGRHTHRQFLESPLLFTRRQTAPVGDQLLELDGVSTTVTLATGIAHVLGGVLRRVGAFRRTRRARLVAAVWALIAVARRT